MTAANKPTIILHVGHGKTGSSFIQSSLALSTDNLRAAGISYPYHRSFENARKGHISSGNLTGLNNLLENISRKVDEGYESRNYLFSNETLFFKLRQEQLKSLSLRFELVIVLFIRDPMELAISSYGQHVKRGGFSGDFHEFCIRHQEAINMPERVLKFIKSVRNEGYQIRTVNYSRHKKDIIAKLEEVLEIREKTLLRPEFKIVNRSLTKSELYLQRRINKVLGTYGGKLISDPLCNQLTDIRSEALLVSDDFRARFLAHQRPYMEKVNELIPESESYELTSESLSNVGNNESLQALTFSEAQVDVFAASLANEIRSKMQALDKYHSSLVQIAEKVDKNSEFTIDEGKVLHEIVELLRPKGSSRG